MIRIRHTSNKQILNSTTYHLYMLGNDLKMQYLRVREIRKKHGMTQRDLAGAMGLSISAISQIERGEIEPNLSTLIQLSKVLKCMPCEIYPPLSRFQLEAHEFEVIRMFRGLPAEDRNFLTQHLKQLHQTRSA